jgi:hypothetical protein
VRLPLAQVVFLGALAFLPAVLLLSGGELLSTWLAAQLTAAKICGVLEITTPVKGWSEVGVPAGWKDDGITLTAPHGNVVVKGFRDWVLTHGWNPVDVPEGPESYANPVEYSDPASGVGSIQAFALTGQLCWTAAKGVYVAGNGRVGVEMHALRTALEAARTAVAVAQGALAQVT